MNSIGLKNKTSDPKKTIVYPINLCYEKADQIYNLEELRLDINCKDLAKRRPINPYTRERIVEMSRKLCRFIGLNNNTIDRYIGLYKGCITRHLKQNKIITINNTSYHMIKIIGKGAFGQVYLLENIDSLQKHESKNQLVIKVQRSMSSIEYLVLSYLYIKTKRNRRLLLFNENNNKLKFYLATSNESILFLPYCKLPNLIEFVEQCKLNDTELFDVACIILVKLLDFVNELHSLNIFHMDIKPNNVLIDLKSINKNSKGQWDVEIKVIDFNKSLYLEQENQYIHLKSKSKKSKSNCNHIYQSASDYLYREGNRSTPCSVDYVGIADCIHIILFKSSMKLKHSDSVQVNLNLNNNSKKSVAYISKGLLITNSFKRYWKCDILRDIFVKLLNYDLLYNSINLSNQQLHLQYDIKNYCFN